ncbi:hypothetical protein [Sphingobium yanoikuyae]|uniref:Uncharacterized protein n=1 Tax=Sphingobium yanoikuyae TaxID=13690 RepID=A0A0J9FP98_SPHYA|nr:hypothetical protein [Sphingobium yanoikuyae]ATP18555.1 hypothetical protein BV87_09235 [Sphingobium yanoikuyae]KMW30190.1 hypothetical protein BV87_07425 [Sphingobium yanoikuyae]
MERDWERAQEQGRRDEETFRRIHQLVKRGYQPDWTIAQVEDAIWFEHPGRTDRLILYPDGKVVNVDKKVIINPADKDDKDRIYNVDKGDPGIFDRWLRTVELPTWRQRTRADREKYVWIPLTMVMFYGIIWCAMWVVKQIWASI